MTTIRDKIAAALLARGEREEEPTKRYRVFTRTATTGPDGELTNGKPRGHYFVGKAGALRVGSRVSSTLPVREEFRQAMIKKGEAS